MQKVAIQGDKGSFHERAVRVYFAKNIENIEIVYCETFRDVYKKLVQNQIDYALLGYENGLHGHIYASIDLLVEHKPTIVGEQKLLIHHNLLIQTGTTKNKINEILSQDIAISQCTSFLEKNFGSTKISDVGDTALAAKMVKESDGSVAAIASIHSANEYGLDILYKNIENENDNTTRFLLLQNKPSTNVGTNFIAIFTTSDEVGALNRALEQFSKYGVNLHSIVSRPTKTGSIQYQFLVECIVDINFDKEFFLKEMEQNKIYMDILGSFNESKAVE